jgi:hypothetical protein
MNLKFWNRRDDGPAEQQAQGEPLPLLRECEAAAARLVKQQITATVETLPAQSVLLEVARNCRSGAHLVIADLQQRQAQAALATLAEAEAAKCKLDLMRGHILFGEWLEGRAA